MIKKTFLSFLFLVGCSGSLEPEFSPPMPDDIEVAHVACKVDKKENKMDCVPLQIILMKVCGGDSL